MTDQWNAFIKKDLEIEPLESGRLNGMTFAVKDVFAIKDYTNTAGNPDWLRTHAPASQHADAVRRLLNQGAKLRGTTHTDELMYSLNGENYHYGTPVNPKAPNRIPGGSSSGSAVAVAAGEVDFALGTDTLGSVRVPSSYCGIFGFRPTHGIISMDGVIPLAKSFDTIGWMGRNPEILLEVADVLITDETQTDYRIENVFIGNEAWSMLGDDVKEKLWLFVELFETITGNVKKVNISDVPLGEWANAFRFIQGWEIWNEHGKWVQDVNPQFGPGIAERFNWTSTIQEHECDVPFKLKKKLREEVSRLIGKRGVLVIPTTPGIAPLLNLASDEVEQNRMKMMQLACIASLTGLPQVTLPLAEKDGCPMGISIIANHHQDKVLLDWVKGIYRQLFVQQGK